MRKILVGLLLFMSVCPLWGQTSKEEIFQTIEKSGGVYYAYPGPSQTGTPAPKGYEPFYVSHYGRHGSRYLIGDNDYKWVLELFEVASKSNALTSVGKDVLDRLRTVWIEAEGHGGDLSPLGVRQHRGIAERMFQSYPGAFSGKTSISARSTIVVRCVLSMDAFCERLKELNPQLQITREASNRYMGYLNYHSQESNAFTGDKGPWREEYRKFEESHTNPARMMKLLFSDSMYVVKNVNPHNLMWGFYWIASDMQNMETKLSFYDIFEKQELFDLWQCFNYRFYVCDANYSYNKGLVVANAKPLLRNILESAEEVIKSNGNGATLRFGHDGNVIPLAAILRLQNINVSIGEPEKFYQVWSDFKVAPMAGNIQMVFYRNKKGGDILVKFLLNEHEVSIPVESELKPYYKWKDVKSFYESILNQ